jgi:hypothetical protein
MDANELAKKMLEWGDRKAELDALEEEIKVAVMELGATQTVGKVRASFSTGRKSYDYQRAVESYEAQGLFTDDARKKYSKIAYDYRAICNELMIVAIPFTESPPSVTLRMMD